MTASGGISNSQLAARSSQLAAPATPATLIAGWFLVVGSWSGVCCLCCYGIQYFPPPPLPTSLLINGDRDRTRTRLLSRSAELESMCNHQWLHNAAHLLSSGWGSRIYPQ
jgi:hypothetical protein